MKILITYKSKTGFTRKYAEIVSQEIDCTLMEFKDVTEQNISDFDMIVFGSRIHAGRIDGLKKAKEMLAKSRKKKIVIFATGGTPNEATEVIDKIWNDNLSAEELSGIPHFYMQGGMCYEKMTLFDKLIMKMVSAMMSKKKDKDSYETGFEQAITSSYDISSKEYAQPLIDYLKGQ